MPFLESISRKPASTLAAGFPFTVPAIRTLGALDLGVAVTCFVGENGSGKSTLLEALALAAGLPAVGADDLARDGTLGAQRAFARTLRLSWSRRTSRGFFLRAEDFFGYVKRLTRERAELEARMVEIETEYRAKDRSAMAMGLAQMPVRTSLADMTRRYGVDLDANSHGESFLRLFQSRFVPGGLYLMDEPEAALSPQSQLGLLAILMDMVERDAQFVIATHSPILLAFPDALIYSFDATPVAAVAYDDLPHVALTRAFLNAPERYLRRLGPAAE
jgi:predicted ATPase